MQKTLREQPVQVLLLGYALAIGSALLAVEAGSFARADLPDGSYFLLLIAAAISARFGGFGPGVIAASVAATALTGLLHLPGLPRFNGSLDAGRLLLFSGAALLLSALCHELRNARLAAHTLAWSRQEVLDRERTAERRYRELAEGSEAMVWEASGEPPQIVFANARMEDVFGHGSVPLLAHPEAWSRILHSADLERVLAACREVLTSGISQDLEHRAQTEALGTIWVRTRLFPLRDVEGAVSGVRALMSDITSRREAEETLRKSEEWYRRIVDTSYEGIWLVSAEGRTLFANERMAEMLGTRMDRLTGHSAFLYTFEEDRPAAQRFFQRLRYGRKSQHDFRLRRADGTPLWAMVTASPVTNDRGDVAAVLGMVTEVTDRKRAEEALRFLVEASSVLASSLDYQTTLERLARLAVPVLADWCAVDLVDEDGSVRRLASAHVEPEKQHLIGELGRTVDAKSPLPIHQVIQSGEPLLITDMPVCPGALQLGSAIIVPLAAQERTLGAITFVKRDAGAYDADDLALAEDLANRAAFALDNARLYRELQLADQRKDQFMAMLAHELRNPLTPIRNAAQMLRRQPEDRVTVERVRTVVERQVKHMARLTDDLLDVSRITRGKIDLKRETVDLGALVLSVSEDHRGDLEARGISLAVELDTCKPLWVEGDPVRLAQVLGNLLINAGKFTDEGGLVTLRAWHDAEARTAVISVADTGIGIDPEVLPHVFEAFTQADTSLDRTRGGLGLGLSLVKGLVELHGGTVSAVSPGSGRGAEFRVTLPALAAAAAAPRPAPSSGKAPVMPLPAPENPERRGRVLVIEDNADAAETMRDLIELFGYDAVLAHSGPEGVAAARDAQPDLVLCDIGLPGMDGYDVATTLRSDPSTSGIRLIAVTGYGQEEDRRRSHDAGFDVHLTKPVDPDELEELLARTGS